MQSFDAIIVGGGIIGISLAIELRKRGLSVLVLDRGEPGHESSTAGAGMLAAAEVEGPPLLSTLAYMSAEMYPSFVAQAEAASGLSVDFHREGAICLAEEPCDSPGAISTVQLARLEPGLAETSLYASFSSENAVDPRTLMPALIAWAKHEGVHIHGGSEVTSIAVEKDMVTGLVTRQTSYQANIVVNCAGAWAAEITPELTIPVRPVKGHMLALIPAQPKFLQHVVRSKKVYLVPRRDGRIAVGSTVEEAGFDKRVDPSVIQKLHQEAANLIPALGEARIHESWAGLRPSAPDGFPILGPTSIRNYFVSTGHFRDGILLAPASARVMADVMLETRNFDLTPLALARFRD